MNRRNAGYSDLVCPECSRRIPLDDSGRPVSECLVCGTPVVIPETPEEIAERQAGYALAIGSPSEPGKGPQIPPEQLPAPMRFPGLGGAASGLYWDKDAGCPDRSEQKALWRAGRIPAAWPRPFEPQEKPFKHGRTTPVKYTAARAIALEKVWAQVPPARKPYERDKNPRSSEIPVDKFGDPDLRWFVDGPEAGKILVMFSGGKDSLALLLYVIEVLTSLGLDPSEHVEAWHQSVDGRPPHLGGRTSVTRGSGSDYENAKWDWPVTEDYCRVVCDYLKIPLYFGWREGGLQGMVLKGEHGLEQRPLAWFELPSGELGSAGGTSKENVRMSYPATTPNLKSRWCTSEAKIDVAESQLRAREDLRGKRILYCSGERAEESANRATYCEREFNGDFIMATGEIKGLHASHGRHVENWRPLLRWCELDVWAIIRRHGIRPHPAYAVGFSRLSCMTCIFGNKDQWASVRRLDPTRFEQFATTEEVLAERQEKDVEAGVQKAEKRLVTMKGKGLPITEFADKGEPFRAGKWSYAGAALSVRYEGPIAVDPAAWELPAGAFQEGSGPP